MNNKEENREKTPILELKNLSKDFKRGMFHSELVRVVDNVSFTLTEGETFGLLGNSGCGKTTISRMITNLISPSEGQIRFLGKNIHQQTKEEEHLYHRKVQMVFQNPEASLEPSMKIRQSMIEVLKIHHMIESNEEARNKIESVLEKVGVEHHLLDRYPHQISGGEAQRLVICRALLLEPQILILDEPTSMLDVSVQARIMRTLNELQKEFHLTYLYITHDIELLEQTSDRIGVMNQGKLVEQGETKMIMEYPSHPYTQKLIRSYKEWE